jgi:RNA polymerase sigma-70 factor (ECF subfamily)
MEASAFKLLFLPYHRKLFRMAYAYMGNTQDAEDLVQETYAKLWGKRHQLDHVLNAEAYSVATLKNLCMDALRSTTALREETPQIETLHRMQADVNIADEMERKDTTNCLKQLIDRLPAHQRLVMTLRDVDDCSFEEIETMTGLNSVNIRSLLSRARKKIREQFNEMTKDEHK